MNFAGDFRRSASRAPRPNRSRCTGFTRFEHAAPFGDGSHALRINPTAAAGRGQGWVKSVASRVGT
jgi:hypothetical protein